MQLLTKTALLFAALLVVSCAGKDQPKSPGSNALSITGTWKLLNGTLIEKEDTTITDYTGNVSFIKIINATHFAFLQHDTAGGKDSATAVFAAGGGTYTLTDSAYTEHLQYCSAREWEGNKFDFTVSVRNDTLTQYGVEKVASANVNRINIERYVRLK